MRIKKQIITILFITFFLSCKNNSFNPNDSQGGRTTNKEIATEDMMIDENRDIIESDTTSSDENVKTQKQWVNCKYCHGKGIEICSVCNGYGYERYSDGSRIGDDVCYYCNGNGTFDDCPKCDGRGQVLEEF